MYDGLYTFAMRMINIVCAAGVGILTARLLGPAGKGIYAMPSVEAGLITAAYGGLNSALSYFLLNRKPGRQILRPAFFASAVYVVAGAIALAPIVLFSGHAWSLLPAMLFLPASAAINLVSGYAVGIKRVRYFSSINVAVTVLTLVLLASGLFLIARAPAIAIAAWLGANVAIAATAVTVMLIHSRTLQGDDPVTIREFLTFGIKVGFVALISLLNYRADLYIVALLSSSANLGMYTVAVSAAESLLVPTQVAALVTSPHIGSLERGAAVRLTARCVRNNLLVALAVCGALFALAHPIVRFLYGAAFLPTVPALRILLIGVFGLSLASPLSSYFTLKLGKPEIPLRLAGTAAAICIVLAILLVPGKGIVGAAFASTVAYIGVQGIAFWYFSHTTGTSLRAMLVPTREDLEQYRRFLLQVVADGRRLLRPASSAR